MVRRVQDAVWTQVSQRTPAENRFLLLIPLVGVVTGLASVLISHWIAFLQKWCWGSGQDLLAAATATPWPYRILIPVFGGLLVALIGRLFRTETRGAGTADMIQSLALKGGHVSLRQTLPRTLAAIVTMGVGGSLGREGPVITLGGAIGSSFGRRFALTTPQVRILLCAAAGSAIAAVYNAPIGGSLFALEVLMGNFALEVFGPVVVASVLSTLIFRSAMGSLPRFVVPAYELVSGWELPAYLVLGVIGGLISLLFVRSIFWTEDLFDRLRIPKWIAPVVGFALLGGIGVFYPHVFGNGYETVNLALHERLPWELLLILPVAKLVATALTLGGRGAGGLFMPSLAVGGLLGGAFGYGVHRLFPEITAGPGAYTLVGMGAIVAGTTHAPLTAIMLIYEQTNSYLIVLPLMFTCIISSLTVRLFQGETIHEETLRRRGVVLPRGPEASVMRNLHVADVMHSDVVSIQQAAPFREVVERFLRLPHNFLYVVNEEHQFRGAIPLHAIKDMLHQREDLDVVVALDLVDSSFGFVTPTMSLAETMEAFWRCHCERLPVLADPQSRRLVGWISKRDLIGIYSQEILQKQQLLGRFSVQDGDTKREVLVELPEHYRLQSLIVPPLHEGKMLGTLALRSAYNIHVLQIKHADPATGTTVVAIADAQSPLAAGDQLIVIGTVEDIARLMADWALGTPEQIT